MMQNWSFLPWKDGRSFLSSLKQTMERDTTNAMTTTMMMMMMMNGWWWRNRFQSVSVLEENFLIFFRSSPNFNCPHITNASSTRHRYESLRCDPWRWRPGSHRQCTHNYFLPTVGLPTFFHDTRTQCKRDLDLQTNLRSLILRVDCE